MQRIAEAYTGETLMVVNPFEPKACDSDADAISLLADSIKLMAYADYFITVDDSWRFRGCDTENKIAMMYNVKAITASMKFVAPDVVEELEKRDKAMMAAPGYGV